jgi:hypothetical protein
MLREALRMVYPKPETPPRGLFFGRFGFRRQRLEERHVRNVTGSAVQAPNDFYRALRIPWSLAVEGK